MYGNEFPYASIIAFFPKKSWGSISNIDVMVILLHQS